MIPSATTNKAIQKEDVVNSGQGEFIVCYNPSEESENKKIEQNIFEKCYNIINQISSFKFPTLNSLERSILISNKIKAIDEKLQAIFIPRTLYELIFIVKSIKEDLRKKTTCPFYEKGLQELIHYPETDIFGCLTSREAVEEIQSERKCWHTCYFNDIGSNENISVKKFAYRINQVMIKKFAPKEGGFTYKELANFAEREIQFLKDYYQESPLDLGGENPTSNFSSISEASGNSFGLRDDNDAQLIRNAILLECSEIAQNSFLLYRGATFEEDSCTEKDNPYSLSYGTSLFAGCVYDRGATAFHYMRNKLNAFTIPVNFEQAMNCPFFIPPTNVICQLFGHGETFHARSKVWAGHQGSIPGVDYGNYVNNTTHLRSELSRKELTRQFEEHQKYVIQLK